MFVLSHLDSHHVDLTVVIKKAQVEILIIFTLRPTSTWITQ